MTHNFSLCGRARLLKRVVLPISHGVSLLCRNSNVGERERKRERPTVIFLNYLSLSLRLRSEDLLILPFVPDLLYPLHAILGGNIVAPLVLILKQYRRGRLSLITHGSYARSPVAIISILAVERSTSPPASGIICLPSKFRD